MTDVDMIQSLAACTAEQAQVALSEYKTVEAAVDALLAKPVVSGQKYIPNISKVAYNDPEQEARCAKGRELMDKLTAVSSAAQKKIQSGQQLAGGVVSQDSAAPDAPQELSVPTAE
jgi:hypothetical protein